MINIIIRQAEEFNLSLPDDMKQLLYLVDQKYKERQAGQVEVEKELRNLIEDYYERLDRWECAESRDYSKEESLRCRIFLASIFITADWNIYAPQCVTKTTEIIRTSNLPKENQLFLYKQISHLIFVKESLQKQENKVAVWKLFNSIVESYGREYCSGIYGPIPYEQRNHNLYIVITSQLLVEQHGPTKTALDRCKVLIEDMGKNVLLINTAECLSWEGFYPFFGYGKGNYLKRLQQEEMLEWKGCKVPYFQCDENMPDPEMLRLLLQKIYEMRPEYIIDIGAQSVVANLCNMFQPVLGIGLCPSEVEQSCESIQAVGKKMTQDDYDLINQVNYDKSGIIESVFTSGLRAQSYTMTKEELGIHDDRFRIIIPGQRLDSEINEEFANLLKRLPADQFAVYFCGNFETFDKFIKCYPELGKLCYNLGFRDDIFAVYDHMDLFVNPIRRGNGTSCVEAMSKGIPVVTTRYGDVAINAGDDFIVNDYDQMYIRIMDLYHDTKKREKYQLLAKERAAYLQDTTTELMRILRECRKIEAVK